MQPYFSLTFHSLKEISFVAKLILRLADDHKIWVLEGDMGAGKTTLVKAVCSQLGVDDTVQSPTYSLVNEYRTFRGEPCYHFDLYRIKDECEAMDIGIEEYFDSGNFCFVEWPGKIPTLLPERYLKININLDSENTRTLQLSKYE
jgi:tRNA threonylcarbamoyladenosine biosynthesis protein TsaE